MLWLIIILILNSNMNKFTYSHIKNCRYHIDIKLQQGIGGLNSYFVQIRPYAALLHCYRAVKPTISGSSWLLEALRCSSTANVTWVKAMHLIVMPMTSPKHLYHDNSSFVDCKRPAISTSLISIVNHYASSVTHAVQFFMFVLDTDSTKSVTKPIAIEPWAHHTSAESLSCLFRKMMIKSDILIFKQFDWKVGCFSAN